MYTIEKDFSRMAYRTDIVKAYGRDFDINYLVKGGNLKSESESILKARV